MEWRHGSRGKRGLKGLCNYRHAGGRLCDKQSVKRSAKLPYTHGMGFCKAHLEELKPK